mmetsp:Transcript_77940/g.172749  ORF Transcript_77940/g.172749 Transcript_77940/m.172749 type:complete len:204 (-) Transcript_77940:57-668(-)
MPRTAEGQTVGAVRPATTKAPKIRRIRRRLAGAAPCAACRRRAVVAKASAAGIRSWRAWTVCGRPMGVVERTSGRRPLLPHHGPGVSARPLALHRGRLARGRPLRNAGHQVLRRRRHSAVQVGARRTPTSRTSTLATLAHPLCHLPVMLRQRPQRWRPLLRQWSTAPLRHGHWARAFRNNYGTKAPRCQAGATTAAASCWPAA